MLKEKTNAFLEKYQTHLDIAFFVGGFLFDIIFISDPDDLFSIAQQIVYLLIVASLIHYEILYRLRKWRPTFSEKFWPYRDFSMHFLLGSLLSVYSLFYIKSASFLSSFIFLGLLITVILLNELSVVQSSKVAVKVAFFAICVFSFFSVLFPIIFGFVGWVPFLFSVAATVLIFWLQYKILQRSNIALPVLHRTLTGPASAVLGVFLLFYFLGWIPPVPLSVTAQGIYHNVEKREGQFILTYENTWKFWQDSDKVFKAQPGDKLYFYAQIYSPARISDQIILHWQMKNAKGDWMTTDKVPLSISGGRKEGYRTFATKANYQPGEWRVSVETSLGSEISRYYFDVVPAEAGSQPQFIYKSAL